jgi:hypothetical protein
MVKETNLPYLWHYDVHYKRFQEVLLYIQLLFLPIYRKEDIFNRLISFFKKKISLLIVYTRFMGKMIYCCVYGFLKIKL